MSKMELPVMPNLIPRLLSDGVLRRADSRQKPTLEKKRVEWVSSLIRLFDPRLRTY